MCQRGYTRSTAADKHAHCRWLWMATLKECNCFREGWLLKHIAGKLFHSGVSPTGNARRRLTLSPRAILFCLLCYRLSV